MAILFLRTSVLRAQNIIEKAATGVACSHQTLWTTQWNRFPRTNQATEMHPVLNQVALLPRGYSKRAPIRPEREVETDSDSDSDSESSGRKRGESEFWRQKMRTFHGLLDINKDGVISYEDAKILVDRFVNLGHLSPQNAEEFHLIIKAMWEERFGNIYTYNLVTTEQYLEDMHHVLNDKQLRRKVHHFLPYLFKALDKDKSGSISVGEYKLFFECLGLPQEAAVVSFNVIDENNDGRLSLKEFVKLGRDYFLTEDQSKPSKIFWGPLGK